MSNLLVVDWDYFTVMEEVGDKWPLYDWGHSENALYALYSVGIWPTRAAGFVRHNLPLPPLSGEEGAFWERFQIDEEAVLYYGDSNVNAFDESITPGVSEIWLYDAHHDCGYQGEKTLELIEERGMVDCESWMIGYYLLNNVLPSHMHVRYPQWKTYAFEVEPEPALGIDRQTANPNNEPDIIFDTVYVCRSSAWTPPWHDNDFNRFIQDAPIGDFRCLDETDTYENEGLTPRPFSMEAVNEVIATYDKITQNNIRTAKDVEEVQGT